MNLLFIVALIILLFGVWKVFLETIFVYLRAVNSIGSKYVSLVYYPFSSLGKVHLDNAILHGNSFHKILKKMKENPQVRVIIYHVLFFRMTILVDPKLIRQFSLKNQELMKKKNITLFSEDVLGGLLGLEGEKWKKSRKLLSNLFNFELLKQRQRIIEKIIKRETSNLDSRQQIKLDIVGTTIAGQSVVQTLFGQQYNKIRINGLKPHQEVAQIITLVKIATRLPFYMLRFAIFGGLEMNSAWLTNQEKKLRDRLLQFHTISAQYLKVQQMKYKNNQKVAPFLQVYFKNKDMYPDLYHEIINQLWIFLFAGQDTTGNGISMIMYQLSCNPQIQQRLRVQLNQTQDIHNCKLLNNFIYQTLRKDSVVVLTMPRQILQYHNILDLPVRKGDVVTAGFFVNNHNPKYFNHPDSFNIQNVSNQMQNNMAFTPFYTGPRNCIGQHMALMEMRLTVKHILKQYRLTRTDKKFSQVANIITNKPLDSRLVKFQLIN